VAGRTPSRPAVRGWRPATSCASPRRATPWRPCCCGAASASACGCSTRARRRARSVGASPGSRPARLGGRGGAEPGAPGETLPVVDLLGDVHDTPVAARLRFELAGGVHTLVATAAGDGLFVNFRDGTSGVSSYGAGRFLRVEAPRDGRARIDFHRAHHPPCAHTPHATCPLPPLANRLPLAVTAGERSASPA
jgi:uncharacterized protein